MKQPRLRFTIANTDWDALRRSAQQDERRRIAQELHDTLLQGFTRIPRPSPKCGRGIGEGSCNLCYPGGNGIVYNRQPSLWRTALDGDVNDKEQKKDAK